MGSPPLLLGALNETEADALLATLAPITGGLGTVAGVTLLETADNALLPTAVVANTRQVTATPFTSPPTVIGGNPLKALCVPQVAVYPVMAEPPLLLGAAKLTVTCVLPATATPMIGTPGNKCS